MLSRDEVRELRQRLNAAIGSAVTAAFSVASVVRQAYPIRAARGDIGQTRIVIRGVIDHLGSCAREAETVGHPHISERCVAASRDLEEVLDKWLENGTDV